MGFGRPVVPEECMIKAPRSSRAKTGYLGGVGYSARSPVG